MNSKITRLKNAQAQIEVTLTSEEVKKFEDLAITRLTKTMHIEWCRDWHLTEATVREKWDKGEIANETISQAINWTMTEVVMKEKVFPISQPRVEIKSKDPLEFTAIFDTTPEVKLWDYKKHSIKLEDVKVSDKEINEQVDMFRAQVWENKEVKRVIKKWDFVNLDFEGFDMEWKSVPNTKSDKFDMEIWSWKMIPWFEEEATWMKAWEEKEFKITFPKEYHAAAMAWKDFKFKIKINTVSEKILPELDEKFVEKITWSTKSVEDFKNEIKTHLITKKEWDNFKALEEEFLWKLLEVTDFEVSETDKEWEIARMIDWMKMQWLQMWKPWEKYLEEMWKTEEDFKKDFAWMAISNIKKRYIVQEIIQAEEIRIADEMIELEIKRYASDAEKAWKDFKKEDYEKWWRQFESLRSHFAIEEMFKRFIKK
jgi:trigger factor